MGITMASWVRRVGSGGRWALWILVGALVVACGGGGGGGGGDSGPPVDGAPGGVGPIATEPGNQALPRIEPYERTSAMAMAMAQTLRLAPAVALFSPAPAPASAPSIVTLAALTPRELAVRDAALAPSQPPKARQIGLGRAVPALADAAAFAGALVWQPGPGGGRIGAVRVRSPGAAGLRLGLRVERLPPGATLAVQGSVGAAVTVAGTQVLQTLARDAAAPGGRNADGLFWLPPVAGDAVTLSIELPASAQAAPWALAVPQVSHLWWTHAAVRDAAGLKIGEAGACNLDAACSPEYAFESRSVARLEFVDNGNAFLCTGTLLADTTASGAPWLLAARHCIGNQATASTLTTFWFYRATACNSNTLDPAATQRSGGATLLYTSEATDSAFLRLEQSPPAGAVHAGALLGPPAVGSALVGLHHPGGDLLKLSVGRNVSYAQCNGTTCSLEPGDSADYLTVGWNAGGGTTESGSSGSAVFAAVGARRYVVGHLFAGSATCTSPQLHDFYGRLDKDYPSLRQYLGSVPGT